jgi:S1/P1 Nuclease
VENPFMKRIFTATLILTLLIISRLNSDAWSSPGHMVIASIAYRELSDAEKTWVNNLLIHHPEYSSWRASYRADIPNLDLETFIFMRASTWPDEIRRKGSLYDHPEWHFIDYPLEPPTFPEKPGPSPTNDILYGISQSERTLTNQNASPEERAVYLSWLIHLVGDIHQPLHCATLVNDDYAAPVGDRGGNSFYVRPAEAAVNLHSIWDKALGSRVNPQAQFNYATELRAVYPRTNLLELSAHQTPGSWSLESREIAVENAYLHGNLKGSKEKENAPALPGEYTRNLKPIAERQAALAGYRLADAIKQILH